jgi:hypothetical protein
MSSGGTTATARRPDEQGRRAGRARKPADGGVGGGPRRAGFGRGAATTLAGALLGAALLLAAEPSHLYALYVAGRRAPAAFVSTGAHDSYALVPIAALAGALAAGAWSSWGQRAASAALAALTALGVVALAIALLGDLPSAHRYGVLRLPFGRLAQAEATLALGFYLETLGGVALVLTGVWGMLSGAGRRAGGAGAPGPLGNA